MTRALLADPFSCAASRRCGVAASAGPCPVRHAPHRRLLRPALATGDASASSAAAVTTAAPPPAAASSPPKTDEVIVYFRQEGTSTVARPGEDFLEVASRCRADIPTGCLHGSCGVCEVELFKYSREEGQEGEGREGGWRETGSPAVLRACVAKVPRGWGRVEVGMMSIDQVWGQDGWDT
ncbi:hypothetical protein GPECTOR_43g912 [Gonium pectorale]|uniref:2Fe-2S ferredoxin-type domain-containing protein n=1 Tax=Gonium pectorale TaxID=33097 RepID=A0A150G9E9_GONPE|nr:hypothetical protein GPECTOR_43g912 [Gonium pectorale]|eukprot:KXZ46476.1 hypothetical protein GPECTOR_43g912 [Gonium pectorale]